MLKKSTIPFSLYSAISNQKITSDIHKRFGFRSCCRYKDLERTATLLPASSTILTTLIAGNILQRTIFINKPFIECASKTAYQSCTGEIII